MSPPHTTTTHTHTHTHTHYCTQFAFETQHLDQAFPSAMLFSKALSPCVIMNPLCLGSKFEIRSVGSRLSRRKWDDNIEMNIQEVGCGGMDWIELAQDRGRWRALVNTVMNIQVP